jgi:hypothetical protein
VNLEAKLHRSRGDEVAGSGPDEIGTVVLDGADRSNVNLEAKLHRSRGDEVAGSGPDEIGRRVRARARF